MKKFFEKFASICTSFVSWRFPVIFCVHPTPCYTHGSNRAYFRQLVDKYEKVFASFCRPTSIMAFRISDRSIVRPNDTAAMPASLSARSFPLTPTCSGTNMKLMVVCLDCIIDSNDCLRVKPLSTLMSTLIGSPNKHTWEKV